MTSWLVALFLLLSSGITYHILATQINAVANRPIRLEKPLSSVSKRIGEWEGLDIDVSETILKAAANDDYLMRSYTNASLRASVSLYVAYSARPRTMLGHRPSVCYPSAGYLHQETREIEIVTSSGRRIGALLHRFNRPLADSRDTLVLNFYIVNGLFTTEEKGFSGVAWRTPNIKGDAARYVTQVQLNAVSESILRKAAAELIDPIVTCFPGVSRPDSYPGSQEEMPADYHGVLNPDLRGRTGAY